MRLPLFHKNILSFKGHRQLVCVLLYSDMEKIKEPKCIFEGGKYIIQERAGNTVRITDGTITICVGIEHIRPTNKEGRMLCG